MKQNEYIDAKENNNAKNQQKETTMKTPLFLFAVAILVAICATAAPEVYPGCDTIDTKTFKFTREIYVDPAKGEQLVPADIKGGDHIHLLAGKHSTIYFNKWKTASLVGNPTWIWFDFATGAEVPSIQLGDISHVLITNPIVRVLSDEAIALNMKQAIVTGARVVGPTHTKLTPDTTGFSTRNGYCVAVLNSSFRNLRSGMSTLSDALTFPANETKVLFQGNTIRNVSRDFSRAISSSVKIVNNKFTGGYLGDIQGDENHDDLFQGFALDGAVFENITIEGNTMIDRNTASKLQADYQGISVFDGLYKHVVIRKNIVVGGAYHGIAMLWGEDVLIENNTVVSSHYGATGVLDDRKFWVGVFAGKLGQAPVGIKVRNNLANYFNGMDKASENTNNIVVKASDYVAFDPKNNKFDFHLKPTSAALGKGAGAL